MNEYVVVRTSRMEAGTDKLPFNSPRRCRYYVRASNTVELEKELESRWPKEPIKILDFQKVEERIFKES